MITIRTGELFVEKYNEENHTDLKPKEIFRLLAEKAFKGGRHMINWTNSKFFVYLKEYNKASRLKKSEPSFEDALDSFCDELENFNCGIETSLNVYGGCGVASKKEMPTTEFNYCDNLHFTIDERYCSFIGAFFLISLGQYCTVINNKGIIWMLYEKSFLEYYKFIRDNEFVNDKQLPAYNGCCLYREIMGRDDNFIEDKKVKDGHVKHITFIEYLEAISKLDNVKIMQFENFGNTNITCGCVTFDLDGVRGWFNIFDNVVTNIDEDIDIEKYCKLFNKDNSLLIASIECGEVTRDMIDPLSDFKKRTKTNDFNGNDKIAFIKEYLKYAMTIQEQELAKNFGHFLSDSVKANKKFSFKNEMENIFNARTTNLLEAISNFCEKANVRYNEGTIPYDVVQYFTLDENKNKLREFLLFTKFNLKKN